MTIKALKEVFTTVITKLDGFKIPKYQTRSFYMEKLEFESSRVLIFKQTRGRLSIIYGYDHITAKLKLQFF